MTGGAREIITGLTGLIPDWIITGQAYLTSIGIWLFALLWFRRKANKPIWGAVNKKSTGNHYKNLMIGLVLGAVLNGSCVLVA
ncbi:hypothetical protein [Pseudoramibacter alactolyticus]|jgi:hypothetical protein|uniref:hypothetical protein n=1 Tax=Pseudoramibacter alactolyticus TaxID=113287 RepID=UPI00248EB3C7|nr:hypothetical protein [Pseudoramibacter alactolyticus]